MKIKIMYHSKTGNTKKVAEAIAQSLNQTVEAIPPAYPLDNVKLLFLGAGVYGGKIDNKMEEFIGTLTERHVKNVALFGTSGSGNDDGLKVIRELLGGKGINVLDETFACRGKAFIFVNRKHPSREDLKNAGEFAARTVEKLQE